MLSLLFRKRLNYKLIFHSTYSFEHTLFKLPIYTYLAMHESANCVATRSVPTNIITSMRIPDVFFSFSCFCVFCHLLKNRIGYFARGILQPAGTQFWSSWSADLLALDHKHDQLLTIQFYLLEIIFKSYRAIPYQFHLDYSIYSFHQCLKLSQGRK